MSVDRKFLFLRATLVLTLLMQEIAQIFNIYSEILPRRQRCTDGQIAERLSD